MLPSPPQRRIGVWISRYFRAAQTAQMARGHGSAEAAQKAVRDVDGQTHDSGFFAQDCRASRYQAKPVPFGIRGSLKEPTEK